MMRVSLARRAAAETLGTAFLLIAVVGSGIMGERLAGGNAAIALLANSLATAGALYALIAWFGPLSGAHFNPLVSLAMAVRSDLRWAEVPAYMAAQVIGAIAGTGLADAMFELPLFQWSQHIRSGPAQWLSEGIASFGLVGAIWVCSRTKPASVPAIVAAYIGAAYWFTSSTAFANPAVSIARAMTDSFAGIRPADVPAFMLAQMIGASAAVAVFARLLTTPDIGQTD